MERYVSHVYLVCPCVSVCVMCFCSCVDSIFTPVQDWSVFINTGNEFDGSDSGARPDEAVSWGKIRLGVEGVKV